MGGGRKRCVRKARILPDTVIHAKQADKNANRYPVKAAELASRSAS